MSVYKHKDSPFYHFDFQFKGNRFHGSTGCTSKREAETFERSVLVVDLKGLYGRAVHCDEKSARRGHRDRDQPSSRREIWQGLQLAGFNVYCESQKADCPITATV